MKKLEAEFSSRATLDLLNIQMHYLILEGKPEKHLDSIFEGIEFVREFSDAGHPIESERVMPGYRKWLADEFWIYYSADGETLTIWRIAHTKQDIDEYELLEL